MNIKPKQILITISAVLFLGIGILVFNSSKGVLFDIPVLEFIKSIYNPFIFDVMRTISFIGSETFLFPAMAIVISYFLIKKKYYIALVLLMSSLGSWLINYGLKQIFQRTRPFEFFLVEQPGLSYPSGHSMVSMTMFLTIAYLLSRGKDEMMKRTIYILCLSYVALMGISRLYLGVHWPTDVIGGFAAGYILFEAYMGLGFRKFIDKHI